MLKQIQISSHMSLKKIEGKNHVVFYWRNQYFHIERNIFLMHAASNFIVGL